MKPDFLKNIKNIQSIGDLFDLQMYLNQEIKSKGLKRLQQRADEVIEEIKTTPNEIPFIRDILKYIFKCSDTDTQIKNNMLNQIYKYRLKGNNSVLRSVAIELLSEYSPGRMLQPLIDIASDPKEDDKTRFDVLQYLMKIVPKESDEILLSEIFEENNEKLSLAAMSVIEHHWKNAPFKKTQTDLERIFRSSTNMKLRCSALELLGIFGEIDIIERVCMLPLNDQEMQASVQKMVQHIISKPRNILYIRWENFEHLIKEWLEKIAYEQVEVTRSVKDEGVDVIAYKQGINVTGKKDKVVVQCKRYANNNIGVYILQQLDAVMKKQQATAGLLITTSNFSNDTKELAQSYAYITLIDREELQNQLNKAFGNNSYCIRNRN